MVSKSGCLQEKRSKRVEIRVSLIIKLKKFLHSRHIIFICRFILGFVFIFAASGKIMDPYAFSKIIYNYKILPDIFIFLPALILPWLELTAGIFLIFGVLKKGSAAILTFMLGVFIIAISINLFRGLSFDCGCFSTLSGSGSYNPYALLIRDILLLIPGIIILTENKKKEVQKNEN